ncbi:MAG: thiolase domain-containing protein [Anaerolineae bacterium]
MRDVSIIGIGQTKVGEHWDRSLRDLAVESLWAAMDDAGVEEADALYVGNMLSGEITGQEHLAALIADFAGLRGIEAIKVEAACGAGAGAVHMGYLAVASGLHDIVIVTGVEKMTDRLSHCTTAALAMAADGDYEAAHGVSFVALNALLMRRYMHEYGVKHQDFAAFSINAHRNAANNPYAMFPFPITEEAFHKARMICDPINLLDSSPLADGAATVILCPTEMARSFTDEPVRIAASAIATDTVALHDRRDPLFLQGAYESAQRAYRQAGVGPQDIDLFELHDAFTIMAALSLEACGFAERGQGVRLAQEGEITPDGRIPISTMGGLKGRGHPVGATGVYQIVELVVQLRGALAMRQQTLARELAGSVTTSVEVAPPSWQTTARQRGYRLGMAQNIGGSGATAVTHILEGLA